MGTDKKTLPFIVEALFILNIIINSQYIEYHIYYIQSKGLRFMISG